MAAKYRKIRQRNRQNNPAGEFYALWRMYLSGREGNEKLLQELVEDGFFGAPASAKHHLNHYGGLVEHTVNVAYAALELCQRNHAFANCDKSAVVVAALLHDICKTGKYVQDGEGKYRTVDNRMLGHGEESVIMALRCMKLTDTEILSIRWHMGAYSGERDWGTQGKAFDRCPEALCVHLADMIAAHREEA